MKDKAKIGTVALLVVAATLAMIAMYVTSMGHQKPGPATITDIRLNKYKAAARLEIKHGKMLDASDVLQHLSSLYEFQEEDFYDGWGNRLYVEVEDGRVELRSSGEDAKPGSSDDIIKVLWVQ